MNCFVKCVLCAELMLLGFISLLLTVFQSRIVKFCVPPRVVTHLLPCSLSLEHSSFSSLSSSSPPSPSPSHEEPHVSNQTVHYHAGPHHQRHLLAEEIMTAEGYCHHKVLKSLLLSSSYFQLYALRLRCSVTSVSCGQGRSQFASYEFGRIQ